ncbi:PglZ domain-containing protein [Clostridium sp. P21]|uniref:PglZ domain-containing protein n=1 Tax=Clostridium muellerianum TaxID=2716538 RepID=A0A7Y0HML9_9CLOT|nr:PglZ domain-containing protein [Clostridium muellerianum]NMM63089.1 PglZ domain-containing protein [Clostridium muellerianum]
MFREYLVQKLGALYEDKIIIFDFDNIKNRYNYVEILEEFGFKIIFYDDATQFRNIYNNDTAYFYTRVAIIVILKCYVPYDVLKSFYNVEISWSSLFPELNKEVILNDKSLDLDLLYGAYSELYENLHIYEKTIDYVVRRVYGKENVQNYINKIEENLLASIRDRSLDYKAWIKVAAQKGKAEYIAAQCGVNVNFSFIDDEFKKFIINEYKSLSSITSRESPIMVNRVLDYIAKSKEKVALIVLDGMSVFDFNILSKGFESIDYEEDYIYAMIPTTTAISRQSLLSGKFPVQLERPFDLSREEKQFHEKAKDLGYLEKQVLYTRGYNIHIGPNIKFLSVIINDIDNLVHGQIQGREGMYNDINLLAHSRKIQELIKELYSKGFNIYITADHGNTLCTGLGAIRGAGVEVETRSKRMVIFKDFVRNNENIDSYGLIDYPGYYLDKQYKYYICNTGTSFDTKDSMVMTHGGISIDEVIVPFIKIKAVQNG